MLIYYTVTKMPFSIRVIFIMRKKELILLSISLSNIEKGEAEAICDTISALQRP